MSKLGDIISEWIASADDWAKKKIDGLPGLFVVKMPARKDTPDHAALEINPADQFGNPTKRRGIYIRSLAEMEQVSKVFGVKKLPEKLVTLCKAAFGDGAVPQTTEAEMLVIE